MLGWLYPETISGYVGGMMQDGSNLAYVKGLIPGQPEWVLEQIAAEFDKYDAVIKVMREQLQLGIDISEAEMVLGEQWRDKSKKLIQGEWPL